MIKNWFITGDTHGKVCERASQVYNYSEKSEETALIILGDVGLNFYRNSLEYRRTDTVRKELVNKFGTRIYCVRGNHEMRPKDLFGIETVFDKDVNGNVYVEEEYPNIRYFIDGEEYCINGHSILVIGGAYSVDKEYRLANKEENGFCGWFENEQLSEQEMQKIEKKVAGKHFDFVFTHTCPYEWMPTDTFISSIKNVDYSMERWMQHLSNKITFNVWCFGHYHLNRVEKPGVECLYQDIQNMNEMWVRWEKYRNGDASSIRYLEKGPKFYYSNQK